MPVSSFRAGRAIVHEPSGQQYVGHVEVAGRNVSIKGHVRIESLGQHGLVYSLGPAVDLTLVNRRVQIEWLPDEASR